MKLQILTPHWHEEPEEITPLLESIALQQSVDFSEVGMIIVYDGDEATPLPEAEWEEKYPFEIRFIHAPHGGVSAARNAALDAATADYVMFCDADDCFCHMCGIYIVFCEIAKGFDTLTSNFTEETRAPGTNAPVYIKHEKDIVFVHGKIHRREYLVENNIRFNPELTIHEDSYFNILAQNCTQNAKYLPTPFYLWRWRDDSICRRDPDYIPKTYPQLIDSSDALVDELMRRGLSDRAMTFVCGMVFETYYTLNTPKWREERCAKYRAPAEQRLSRYINKHRELWEAVPLEQQMLASNTIRTRLVGEGMFMEDIAFHDWLKRVEEMK